jgi:protein-tyrosine phosphatase
MVEVEAGHDRYLRLEGGCNFRDIGGLRAADGRTVRWGRVFRAGVLSYFTPTDDARLSQLGVRAICDLRRADERVREPTRWPTTDVTRLDWADGTNAPAVTGRLMPRQRDAESMRAAMLSLYRELPRWMVPRLQGLFDCVSTDRLPVVVHCSAGKDRTGFAVAMLLSALGVDRATIFEDYLYTNVIGGFEEFARRRQGTSLGLADEQHPLLRMPAEVRRVLLMADADYLQAALNQLDTEFGGVDRYLREAVGLSDAAQARLHAALLL